MKRTTSVFVVALLTGVLAMGWLAFGSGSYEEDRKTGYLDGIRCEAVGRVYFPLWKDKYWEMRGEATSDASQVIDIISLHSKLYVNGTETASDQDSREDDDHAETHIVQTWTNSWYEVSYGSDHLFRHRFTEGWKQLLLETAPCYASKGDQP